MDAARTHHQAAPEFNRHFARTAAIAVAAALVVCLAVSAAISATFSRGADDLRLRNALTVASELETLLTLHVAANTDFLEGVGVAGYSSRGWPIRRAAAVAGTYDRLERDLAGGTGALKKLRALRQLSTAWPQELDSAARNLALANAGTEVQPTLLQHANKTLSSIMTLIADLRSDEREQIADMQFRAQGQLVRQRISLAVAAAAGALLLLFALFTRQRASLTKITSQIVATEAQRRFREYFEQHPVSMLIFDVHSYEILTANAAAQRQYGATLQQLRSMPVDQLRPSSDVEEFRRDLQGQLESGNRGGTGGVRRHRRAGGEIFYVDVTYHLLDFGGREACFVTAHDVTAHEHAKESLRIRSRALDASRNAVIISRKIDGNSTITYVNAAFERITGRSATEAIDADLWKLIGCDISTPDARSVRMAMRAESEGARLLQCRKPDGSIYWIDLHVAPVLDEKDRPTHFVTVFSDVSERVRYQEQLRSQAHEDALTRLPNRLGLKATLADMFGRAVAEGNKLALVFLDLDNFKEVNDTLGHTAGDQVLCEVARRLSGAVSRDEIVVRYAGDEFVAALYGRGDIDSFMAAATAMKETLTHGLSVANRLIVPQASVGVAVFPDHSLDPDTLLKYADAAMYRAKSAGPNSILLFNHDIAIQDNRRATLAQALRHAVASEAFSLAYQPRVNPATGKASGFEALVRWHDPEHGDISPSLFVPIAEETGLIVQIGQWVFEQACLQTGIWASLCPDIVVSVNVSPVQFERSDLPAMIASTLERTAVSARNIELEITEGVLMAPGSLATLRALREMGLSIAIDDFGTGYSSLGYIRSFLADRLKLDMSFVQGIGRSHADEVIVRAVLAMGRTLGMRVVAEGVETYGQLEFLLDNGCDEVQGYWFARPMDANWAHAYLMQDTVRASTRVT
ncbi:EAL domain-containing protein [Paraburkholderia sp. Tr-20389]|nr:EAL domain-containing protein [Paraburkholderia sp. Tr-20389]MBN3751518.1 EAL domain-containing protein [Paraburkholderia sp. Tr-20389]